MLDRRPLDHERQLSASELDNVREDHLPRDKDDKWFSFVEGDHLYMHRSWTGHAIFEAQLRPRPDESADVTDLSHNADKRQFNMDDGAARDLFDRLLTRLADGSL